MYFADLGQETQICSAPFVRAIGWLDVTRAFPQGPSPAPFRDRLARFASRWKSSAKALGWPASAGRHECPYCEGFRAGGNMGIIAGDLLYVCPEMVSHYVAEHDYLPPEEFIEAVSTCLFPWTTAYGEEARRFIVTTPSE